MRLVKKWFEILVQPSALAKERGKDIKEGVKNAALAGLIFAIVVVLIALARNIGVREIAAIITSSLLGIVAIPVIAVACWLLLSGIFYIFAVLLGGKGSYVEQSNLFSLVFAPFLLLFAILTAVSFVLNKLVAPQADLISSILITALSIYILYPLTIALKVAHRYSIKRAILSWLPLALLCLVLLLIALIMPPVD